MLPIQLEDIRCPLGCRKNDETVLTGVDLLHDLPGEFSVVKCRACGLMRTNPRPTQGTINIYYPDDYGPYVGTRVSQERTKRNSLLKKILRPIFRCVFNSNMTILPTMSIGRMLEIGCASGAFLHQMAGLGWQVQGIEFSEKAAHCAEQLGYSVYIGPLETAPEPDNSFDLIVGWMVLEHLHDPVKGLQKLRDWAKPGAWLAISVPNAGSLEFKFFKNKWYALQLPTHIHHFTPASIDKILSAGGWKLEKIHHQRVLNNLIASIGFVLLDNGYATLGQKFVDFPEQGGRWNYVLYPLAWLLSIFGQTGRMTVWARVK
jgi:2-polyprenyl-3-methyl-5-hydroxy-6-metoxy-1,4-benzoquinol methylase